MNETITAPVYWEWDEHPFHPKMTIIKTNEMQGRLKDGRDVFYDCEKKRWYIPERIAKGEVKP